MLQHLVEEWLFCLFMFATF